MPRRSFPFGGYSVRSGSRKEITLPITRLVTGGEVALPVVVLHGRHDGPTVWVNAAIHGDEVNGVEIVRRLIGSVKPKDVHGTLLAVPIVNVYGFMASDRYLPDRRDLNRSFPGSPRASLAGRIAHLLMTEIVARCDYGIDLHTGSDLRSNLPQIRVDLDDAETRRLAQVFGATAVVHSQLRDGSLRSAAADSGVRMLVYEGGEANRWDDWAIDAGHAGVLRVLADVGVLDPAVASALSPARSKTSRSGADSTGDEHPLEVPLADDCPPVECWSSRWVRAARSGILRLECELGDVVEQGDRLGSVSDSFGKRSSVVRAPAAGIVIGQSRRALVNQGDALVHVGIADRA